MKVITSDNAVIRAPSLVPRYQLYSITSATGIPLYASMPTGMRWVRPATGVSPAVYRLLPTDAALRYPLMCFNPTGGVSN